MDIGQMDLLRHIKNHRAKQRQKKPIKPDVFNQISSIVRQYGLKESFLDIFDAVEDHHLTPKKANIFRIRMKTPVARPLFSLVAEEEYHLSMLIINKVDNPYLIFADSPDEILLCKSLYRLNPALSSEALMRYHFETLFLHECAKRNRKKTNRER
ncbi:MAG: hypothetical protein WB792_10405 [Desulfobacterales bacterium]